MFLQMVSMLRDTVGGGFQPRLEIGYTGASAHLFFV
jgi:hypothetical protein